MQKAHRHAALIKAWADGTKIEWLDPRKRVWVDVKDPSWDEGFDYRIKAEPVIRYAPVLRTGAISRAHTTPGGARLAVHPELRAGMLKLTFDPEGKQLVAADIVR